MSNQTNQKDFTNDVVIDHLGNTSTQDHNTTRLINLLEGQFNTKQIINVYLEGLNGRNTIGGENINIDWEHFNRLENIKKKIAYIVSLSFPEAPSSLDNSNQAIERCHKILDGIKEEIVIHHRLTEEQVLHYSTLKHTEIILDLEEESKLTHIKSEISNKYPELSSYITNLGGETKAQEIVKIYHAVKYSIKEGKIKDDIIEIKGKIEPLYKKVTEKIDKLNQGYKNLSKALNQFRQYNPFAEGLDIIYDENHEDIKNMITVLFEIGIISSDNSSSLIDNIIQNDESDIKNKLVEALSKSNLEQKLKDKNLTKERFEELFQKYFSFHILIKTKKSFEQEKDNNFGINRDEFEKTIKQWNDMQRNEVIKLGQKISSPRIGSLDTQEKKYLENLLTNYKRIFRSDDLPKGSDEERYINEALQVAIKNKYPRLTDGNAKELSEVYINEANVTHALFYGKYNPIEQIQRNGEEEKKEMDEKKFFKLNRYKFLKIMEKGGERRKKFLKKHGIKTGKALIVASAGLTTVANYSLLTAALSSIGPIALGALAIGGISKGVIKGGTKFRQNYFDKWINKDRKWSNSRAWIFKGINAVLRETIFDRLDKWSSVEYLKGGIKNIKDTRSWVNKKVSTTLDKDWVKNISDKKVETVFDGLSFFLVPFLYSKKEIFLGKKIQKKLFNMDKEIKKKYLTCLLNEIHAQNLDSLSEAVNELLTNDRLSFSLEDNFLSPPTSTPAPTPTSTPAPSPSPTPTPNSNVKKIDHYETIIKDTFSVIANKIDTFKNTISGIGSRNIKTKLQTLKNKLEDPIDFSNFTTGVDEVKQAIEETYNEITTSQNPVKEATINETNTIGKLYALKQKFGIIGEKYNNIAGNSYTTNDKALITKNLNDIRTRLSLRKI